MKEVDVESLDKMFPKGYVIVYTLPNDDIRVAMFNPERDEYLFKCNEVLTDNA